MFNPIGINITSQPRQYFMVNKKSLAINRKALQERGRSRPVSRVLYRVAPGSNHSSRPAIAHWLKQPTRPQRGPRQRGPIWSCSGWSLPCHELLPVARCALTAPFHPYLIPEGPSAVCSLLHWSWARAPQALPGTLPYGARTFLSRVRLPKGTTTQQRLPDSLRGGL